MTTGIVGLLNNDAQAGEKWIYNFLNKLSQSDPEITIYYEPFINEHRPDFLLIGRKIGVVIIEVKDYSQDKICETSSTTEWITRKGDQENEVRNPLSQIYSYWKTISTRMSNIKMTSWPIYQMVILTGILKDSDVGLDIKAQASSHIPILFKEDIRDYKTFQMKFSELIPKIYNFSENEFKLVKGTLVPTSRLPTLRQTSLLELIPGIDQLKLLDLEQERVAKNLGDGHRLFFGVAGSGKTILLIARARYLAIKHSDWRILILCYNKPLSKYLFRLLEPQKYKCPPHIYTFHGWAQEQIMSAGTPYNRRFMQQKEKYGFDITQFFNYIVPDLLKQVMAEKGLAKYDAILVDEAQDFEPSWFEVVIQFLNPATNSLLITCDGVQGIYERRKFRWTDVGIRAQGRSIKLRKAYRNPAEIGKLANQVLPKDLLERIDTQDEFLSTEEYLRSGGNVELIVKQNRETEYSFIIDKIKEYQQKNQSIIIIFQHKFQPPFDDDPFLKSIRDHKLRWATLDKFGISSRNILIGTPQRTKGLESDVVIIPELDTYASASQQVLLYVGMTRALHSLLLTADKETALIKSLQQFQGARGNNLTVRIAKK